jgi:hypothetical protein
MAFGVSGRRERSILLGSGIAAAALIMGAGGALDYTEKRGHGSYLIE